MGFRRKTTDCFRLRTQRLKDFDGSLLKQRPEGIRDDIHASDLSTVGSNFGAASDKEISGNKAGL